MLLDFNNLGINNLQPQTEFEKKVIFFVEEWQSDSKTVKVQTSGSTGVPKVFDIEKEKMLNSAQMTCDFLKLKKGNTALLCLPIEYISGKMMVVRSFERKLNLFVADPSLKPLENLHQEIDFCAMTPLQVENSLDKIHFIKNLIIGGAAVSESLKKKITQTLKLSTSETKIYETYGMSETLSHIALKNIYPNPDEYFTVFENIDISKDERGCLKIIASKLNSEILQTNDLVDIKNTDQFKFLGRIDNVINSGGAKIFPEQLETLIKKEITNEAVFLAIEDESLGQKLILVIEGSENENLKSQISNLTFEKSFHKPKKIIFIEKIPRTPNGKVNRLELKKKLSV
ncbi:AMP-dependent synthetase [Chryseobacterium formosense]|uniref:AMP-dependent synthetase n=1 Tax=Chryseobacterium formosense TaxID=236814 RepID=A0A085Z4W5_9FLAO|nr:MULTISPECIES: AMP-binding protein [Chryseobacterium]KFE99478.1 AMP-dependent synthetase [Chryseobacterium formosense]OCK49705.1 AMP-dependent synthetase [Chryseobacterium sp. CBo1]SFT81690.1 O-succinylbenzoic acid--CoA ligase [Chryseobacterium formosense]